MASVSGRRFLADPEGEAQRFLAQIKAEAAAEAAGPPPRYSWGSGYWRVIKYGRWPNVTGWAEHRESQRIFAPKLDEFMAEGVPKDEAWRRASDYAGAEMLARTTARKEASDRHYAQREEPTTSPD